MIKRSINATVDDNSTATNMNVIFRDIDHHDQTLKKSRFNATMPATVNSIMRAALRDVKRLGWNNIY